MRGDLVNHNIEKGDHIQYNINGSIHEGNVIEVFPRGIWINNNDKKVYFRMGGWNDKGRYILNGHYINISTFILLK